MLAVGLRRNSAVKSNPEFGLDPLRQTAGPRDGVYFNLVRRLPAVPIRRRQTHTWQHSKKGWA